MAASIRDLSFKPVLAQAGSRVITFDSRRTGQSDSPPPPYSTEQVSADTMALVVQLSLVT
jgi:hypothetical protein